LIDGKFLSVLGAPLEGTVSTVFMFNGMDVSATPKWQVPFNGTCWWGMRAMKMSGDTKIIGVLYIDYRPSFVGPVSGGSFWLDPSNGKRLGGRLATLTMGEVWVDSDAGTRLGCRSFNETEGNFTTLSMPSGSVLSTVLDKYNGISVSAAVTYVIVPKDVDVLTIETFNTATGKLEWYFTTDDSETLYALTLGRKYAVAVWCASVGPTVGFRVRVFDLKQASQEAKPLSSVFIGGTTTGEIRVTVSPDANDRDMALAIDGVGIYYATIDTPSPSPVLAYDYEDHCGFATVDIVRTPKGVVIVAGLNQRVTDTVCQLSAGMTAFQMS